MVGKEAEYREKVRANLRDVLELLQSKKVTDRKMGLEQIEQVFSVSYVARIYLNYPLTSRVW